jgi:serine/threonine-protein kinase RsbW
MAESEVIRVNLPATLKYLNVVSACIAEMVGRLEHLPDRATSIYNIQLAVQEVCVNVVEHAYGPDREAARGGARGDARIDIALTLERDPDRLIVELEDAGRSFDPAAVADPDLDGAQVHGYGLFLMRALMDEVVYQPHADGNRWRLSKTL